MLRADNSTSVALLRSHPFSHLPLHVRCFTSETYDLFTGMVSPELAAPCIEDTMGGKTAKTKIKKVKKESVEARVGVLPPLPMGVSVTLDLRGMPGAFAKKERKAAGKSHRKKRTKEAASDDGHEQPDHHRDLEAETGVPLLHLDDMPLRTTAWETWQRTTSKGTLACALCPKPIVLVRPISAYASCANIEH